LLLLDLLNKLFIIYSTQFLFFSIIILFRSGSSIALSSCKRPRFSTTSDKLNKLLISSIVPLLRKSTNSSHEIFFDLVFMQLYNRIASIKSQFKLSLLTRNQTNSIRGFLSTYQILSWIDI